MSGSSFSQQETFADMFSIMANGDKRALGYVAKFTPAVYNVFMDAMEGIKDGKRA